MSRLRCEHCGGGHDSDYCPGYHAESLSKTAEEIQEAITGLSESNQEQLERISAASADVADRVEARTQFLGQKLDSLESSVEHGMNKVASASLVSGVLTFIGLIGVGQMIVFRERMDQLRHEERERAAWSRHRERMRLEEEASVAGRARRELSAAAALLAAGDSQQAARHVDQSIHLFPSAADTLRIRGVLESQRGEHKQAEVSLKAAITLAEQGQLFPVLHGRSKQVDGNRQMELMLTCGVQLAYEQRLLGRYDDAVKVLESYVRRYPRNADGQLQYLRLLANSKAWAACHEAVIRQAVALNPKLFNLIYVDAQLRSVADDVHRSLNDCREQSMNALQGRVTALQVASGGRNGADIELRDDSSYVALARLHEKVAKQIQRATRDKPTGDER